MWEWSDLWELCLRWQRWIGMGLLACGLLLTLWQQELAWVLWAGLLAVVLRFVGIGVYGYRDFQQAQSWRQAASIAGRGAGMMLVEFSVALTVGLAVTNHKVPHWPVYAITVGAAIWFLGSLIATNERQVSVTIHVTKLPIESSAASSNTKEPQKPGMLK